MNFTLSVDYSKTLEQMIAADLNNLSIDDPMVKRLQIEGKGVEELEAHLFHFEPRVSLKDAGRLIEEASWEVAKTEHLLAFGAKHPDEQHKFPILALGSVSKIRGFFRVPYLSGDGLMRYLGLLWCGCDRSSLCCFLAVRKKV